MPLNLTTVYLRSLSKFNHQVTAFFNGIQGAVATSRFLPHTLYDGRSIRWEGESLKLPSVVDCQTATFSFMLSTLKLNENLKSCVLKKV